MGPCWTAEWTAMTCLIHVLLEGLWYWLFRCQTKRHQSCNFVKSLSFFFFLVFKDFKWKVFENSVHHTEAVYVPIRPVSCQFSASVVHRSGESLLTPPCPKPSCKLGLSALGSLHWPPAHRNTSCIAHLHLKNQHLSKPLYNSTSKTNKLPLVSLVTRALTHLSLTAKSRLRECCLWCFDWEEKKEVGGRIVRGGTIKGKFLEDKSSPVFPWNWLKNNKMASTNILVNC
jgi:hypothetical protein